MSEVWEQATALHTAGDFDGAEKLYDKLLTQNPDNPGLLATLGSLYVQMDPPRLGLSICLLEHASKKLKQSDILSNLGLAYKYSGQRAKALDCFERAVRFKDASAKAYATYSSMYIEAGESEKCLDLCKKAIEVDPELGIAHWNMALSLLADGEWARAWDEHEWGLRPGGLRANRDIGGLPAWDGSPGKKVVIYGEQGIGDEIMFASMLPDVLKTNDIILDCHERLVTLFEKSFPGVKCYGTREDPHPQWPANETADARLAIGSLGQFYRRSREAFPGTPYLKADALPKGRKFRVGISWSGGHKLSRVQKRSVPLSWWKSILNVPDVEFVSLQYTDCKEELDLVNALGYDIKIMDEVVKAHDYYETARLVKSCDLVISVCTSVIHLAGALGVKCWVMTPKNPAWRYQNQGGMPFYRSVRLYRQPEESQDSWIPVVQKVGFDLAELVDSRKIRAA